METEDNFKGQNNYLNLTGLCHQKQYKQQDSYSKGQKSNGRISNYSTPFDYKKRKQSLEYL